VRNWSRYAEALDLRLAGAPFKEIGDRFGVSKQRAEQMVLTAAHILAYRVFRGVPRYVWRYDNDRHEWKARVDFRKRRRSK